MRYWIRHECAVFVGERLYTKRMARIQRASLEAQRAAFDRFKRHADKKQSTVDSLNFVVLESLDIREALVAGEDLTPASSPGLGPLRGGYASGARDEEQGPLDRADLSPHRGPDQVRPGGEPRQLQRRLRREPPRRSLRLNRGVLA